MKKVANEKTSVNPAPETTASTTELNTASSSIVDEGSVTSDTTSTAAESKCSTKLKRRFTKRKQFKKKRITSTNSTASIESTNESETQSINSTVDNKTSTNIEEVSVPEVATQESHETNPSIKGNNESKPHKPRTKKKHFKRPVLPYNGRIIDGVVYATDNFPVMVPRQVPHNYHSSHNQMIPITSNIMPIQYETPLNVRANHSFKSNNQLNILPQMGYKPKQRYHKPYSSALPPNQFGEYYYGHNPFPKNYKKNDNINNKKVTEKFESDTPSVAAIVDENNNASSNSVNTIVATN